MSLKNYYNAHIGNGPSISVDIFDLPYDKFNSENPLVIDSDVVLADQMRTTDLKNVVIMGDFDFSKQGTLFVLPKQIQGRMICQSVKPMREPGNSKNKINLFDENFTFPDGITEIDCTHSIKDFDYFIGRLPQSTKRIIVADSMISNISSDQKKLISAILLMKHYPELTVIGYKKKITLSDELANIAKQEAEKNTPKITEQKPIKEEPTKTFTKIASDTDFDCWTKKDVAHILSDDPFIRSFDMPFGDIEYIVSKMWKNFNRTMVLFPDQDTSLSCISFDDFVELYCVFAEALENAKQEAEEEKTKVKEEPTKPTQVKPEEAKPVEIAAPTPIVIKKYIPKKLWNDITKLCGGTAQTIKFVLNTICSVNVDINETKQGNPVQIIDTNKKIKTSCGYMKKESGNCIVQSVDATTSNDRKRMVWTYLPKEQILVCISAHSEHFCSTGQNQSSMQYKTNIAFAAKSMDNCGEKITSEKIQKENYFDADILLDIIKAKEQLKIIQMNSNQNQK